MNLDLDRVRENVKNAQTEDLLDRLTVFRAGSEPEALEVTEAELRSRGVNTPQIRAHERKRDAEVVWLEPGLAARCCRCARPAVARGRRWLRLFWLVPVFPVPSYFCAEHLPPGDQPVNPSQPGG